MACAFSRRSASPVRITTPVSMSFGFDAGRSVGLADDGAQLAVVDPLLALIGRERDRRPEQGLARDDVVAAGQVLAQPPQMHLGENDLRSGRADVDADAGQRDVVGDPERVVLDRPVVEVVVVVVGVAVVAMREIGPEPVIGEGVAGRAIVGTGHRAWPYRKTRGCGSLPKSASKVGVPCRRSCGWNNARNS